MTLQQARELLGLKVGYTPDDAQRAYRGLALKLHPDKGGDPKAFARLVEAYGIVRDPRKASVPYNPDVTTPFFRKPT